MLLIQAVTWLVEPWLLLLFLGMFWITAFLMVVIIGIMGSSLQRNRGCSSVAERLGISAVGSFKMYKEKYHCMIKRKEERLKK